MCVFRYYLNWLHIVTILTEFSLLFLSRVLIGTGRVCIETLRPLAYSLLAEIVHYVRSDLSLSQVRSLHLASMFPPFYLVYEFVFGTLNRIDLDKIEIMQKLEGLYR